MLKSEAEELVEVIHHHEPEVEVMVSKRWFSRQYQVFVLRDGKKHEYQEIHHYWIERVLVETFCRPLNEER